MDYRTHISVDPKVMLGKAVIKGTRITVELILSKLGQGATFDLLLEDYPHLTKDDILSAIQYASDVVAHEELLAVTA